VVLRGDLLVLGDVDGDADEVRAGLVVVPGDLGAGAQPDPVAVGVAEAEFGIDHRGVAVDQAVGELVEVGVLGVHQLDQLAEGEQAGPAIEAQQVVHRVGPEDLAAAEVPVPEAAAAALQRLFQPRRHPAQHGLGALGAVGLPGEGETQQDDDHGCRRQHGAQHQGLAPPGGQRPGDRLQHGDLAGVAAEIADRRQNVLAVGEGQAHDAGALAEGRQRLVGAEHGDQAAVEEHRARRGGGADEAAGVGSEEHAPVGGRLVGQGEGEVALAGSAAVGAKPLGEAERGDVGDEAELAGRGNQRAPVRAVAVDADAGDDDGNEDENERRNGPFEKFRRDMYPPGGQSPK